MTRARDQVLLTLILATAAAGILGLAIHNAKGRRSAAHPVSPHAASHQR